MKNYFIFQYEDSFSTSQKMKITVIFIHQVKIIAQNTLVEEINIFFQEHSITDKLVVILPSYLDQASMEYFTDKKDITFQRIPGKSQNYFEQNLLLCEFNSNGDIEFREGVRPSNETIFIRNLLRNGSTTIFRKNGGLVESTPDHHFVFPSNKHCSKFIRTGNVLVNQAEVFFVALQLLTHVRNKEIIFCDTSSINVLPYAALELCRRFGIDFNFPTIHSFESYDFFENSTDSFPQNSIILVSSSTSGNIIDRLLREQRAEKNQIFVLYFLGPAARYAMHSSNIICNLTRDDNFVVGEKEFETYSSSENCKLCKDNSRPIKIRGDVFLTIQPKIELHLLSTKDEYYSKAIGLFAQRYRSGSSHEGMIKSYYKESAPDNDYDVYFDIEYLLLNLDKYQQFESALNRNIDKYVPANTKHLLHLPDQGSEALARHILTRIPQTGAPTLVKLEQDFLTKIDAESGSVVIIASCITTGKKLLQISRLMRSLHNLSLVYIVGFFRPTNENFGRDLTNDLKKGRDKNDERLFVAVETIYCSSKQVETSWKQESTFHRELLGLIDEENQRELYAFINARHDLLIKNKESKGFSDNLLLKLPDQEPLRLRKNFAFWDFAYEENEVSQSEVYFTVSTILSNLEQKDITSRRTLKQSNYVRNILSPRNFHRFNDGIIQACLLRSGRTEFFSYDLDSELSQQMKEFILGLIEKYDQPDGEALMEFLLALAVRKLKLLNHDLKTVLNAGSQCPNTIISGLSKAIHSINFT